MYDAIVVGGRCAGAATGMLLARSGYRVLIVDKSRFPSDTMSTFYIQQRGVGLLAQWGLLHQVIASGARKLAEVSYEVPGVRISGPAPVHLGIDGAYAPRRYILDPIIVNEAARSGAEFRSTTQVVGLVHERGRVTGVRLRGADGAETVERCHLVIGADGMRSTVARLAGASTVRADPLMSCVYYGIWQDLPANFELYERPGNWIAVIPTNEDLTVVSVYFPQRSFPLVRKAPGESFFEAVRLTSGCLHDRLGDARQVERLRGTGDQQNFFRQSHGPGWVLVGDAGCHMDTITARGITDAFVQAELLSLALRSSLADVDRLDAGLADFDRRRRDFLAGSYQSTLALAALKLPPARVETLRRISESPQLTETYLAVLAGLKAMDELIGALSSSTCEVSWTSPRYRVR